MARQNLSYYLAERTVGEIIPGKTFEARIEPAPTGDDLKDGEALVETLYLSIDPSMRTAIRVWGIVLARVLATKTSKAKVGDIVFTEAGWTEMRIVHETKIRIIQLPAGAKLVDALNLLGGPGLTAYVGMTKIGKPKSGETVVVSTAAGGTGSIAGQIAKICGARVVGITSTEEKCAWLRDELGFDAALNYKSPTFREDLAAATPNYVNVYFDNVGGEILEMVLERTAKDSRFIMCGAVSGYNSANRETAGVKNLIHVVVQRVHIQGFIIYDHVADFPEAMESFSRWVQEGKLKTKETVIKGGLKEVEGAVQLLFRGANTGKLILEVKPVDEGIQYRGGAEAFP